MLTKEEFERRWEQERMIAGSTIARGAQIENPIDQAIIATKEREIMREKALAYVQANMYKRPTFTTVTRLTPRCVDGRYDATQVTEYNNDSFARPGGDGGYA